MGRPKKKNGIALNVIIDKDISNQLNSFSEKSGLSKTAIVEKSLSLFINKNKNNIF